MPPPQKVGGTFTIGYKGLTVIEQIYCVAGNGVLLCICAQLVGYVAAFATVVV